MIKNYHLNIVRDEFERRASDGTYPSNDNGLSFKEIEPTVAAWKEQLQAVGGPWGWDKRPEYNSRDMIEKLESESSRLFILQRENEDIGYCWAYGANRHDTLGHGAPGTRGIKIENFGFTQAETGKGHGKTLLPLILSELFNDKAVDEVFLESRSTNHAKVVPFYQSIGMELVQVEDLEHNVPRFN